MGVDTNKAIELLNCAEINCGNVNKLGVEFVDVVKMQIQGAIILLRGEIFTESVKGGQNNAESE